jgi:hypothetical protein
MMIPPGFSSPGSLRFGAQKRSHDSMARGVSPSAPIIIDDNDELVLSPRGDDGNESDSNLTVTQEAHGASSRKNSRQSFLNRQSARLNNAAQEFLGLPASVDLSQESEGSKMSYVKTARIAMKKANKEPLTADEQQHWQTRKREALEEEVMNQLKINREQAKRVLRSLQEPSSGSSNSAS